MAPIFSFCAANELFFMAVYLLGFYTDASTVEHQVLRATALACFPIMFAKVLISIVHMCQAAYNIAVLDADVFNAKVKSK